MIEVSEQQTKNAECRQRFVDAALTAEQDALNTGTGFDAEQVHAAMEARARGTKRQRPKAKTWRE